MSGPLLIDSLIAYGRNVLGGPVPKGAWATITHAKYNAQRFVFDDAASEIAGTFAVECPDLLFGNRQFAVPPYPLTYIEIDAKAFFRNTDTGSRPDGDKDERLAYLVDGTNVYVLFARARIADDVGLAMWRYKVMPAGQRAPQGDVRVNIPQTTEARLLRELRDAAAIAGMAPMTDAELSTRLHQYLRANVMFGSAISNISDEQGRALTDATHECSMQWLDPASALAKRGVDADLLSGFYGDVRNYLALVLWLHQRAKVTVVGMPAGAKLVHGKRVPFLSHNVVSISLGRCKTVRRAFQLANERKAPKRHPVAGHYNHRHGHKGCSHEWPLLPDDDGHYICKACGRWRWFVANFDRGTAERGYSTHDYAVKGG